MVLKKKSKILPDTETIVSETLNGIDNHLDYLDNHEVLGELQPVRKKTWQIKNITGGLRAYRKSKNKNN